MSSRLYATCAFFFSSRRSQRPKKYRLHKIPKIDIFFKGCSSRNWIAEVATKIKTLSASEYYHYIYQPDIVMHPTKCNTSSKVRAYIIRKTSFVNKCVSKCLAKVSGPTDKSLSPILIELLCHTVHTRYI